MNLWRAAGVALGLCLSVVAGNAHAQSWSSLATISGTLGNNNNRLCVGAQTTGRPDIGCPADAPLLIGGGISVTGIVSASYFEGDGSRLSNLPSGSAYDRIVSGTTSVIANQNTSITFTTAGNQRMVVGAGGHVGVGTSTPGTAFEVAGASGVRVRNGVRAIDIIPTPDGTNHRLVGVSTQAGFSFENMMGLMMSLTSQSYLGIGTGSPLNTLHVSGTAFIQTLDDRVRDERR